MIRSLPLLGLLWIAYNSLILAGRPSDLLGHGLFHVGLPSQALWSVTLGDILIFAGVLLLYVEIFKATRSSTASILDHALSMLIFVLFLVEFLIAPQAGNSVFFALTLMALLDVVAGFSVTIVAARRDVDLDR
ncbi:MAG: hypothetical protein N3A55_11125 [Methylohalobius sp.]|nr:hypothetical protein [Methylohalobius sp.]